jgi:hypothetical protein
MKTNRREFAALLLGAAASAAVAGPAPAQVDPLPSWNDGAAKQAILKFVHATTDAGSPEFVPPAERVATFDQDGTLWVEHPIYTQLVYCFDRVPEVAKAKPELANQEPFKTVLSGDREAIAKLSIDDLIKIAAATLTAIDVDAFRNQVFAWIKDARDPRWKRPYTELVYQPQIELLLSAPMASKPTSSPAAGRISSAPTRRAFTAFRPSRWSARLAASAINTQPTDARC